MADDKDSKPPCRDTKRYHSGFEDNLEPLQPLNLTECDTVEKLLNGMKKTAFAGRQLGEGVDVFYNMIADPDCFVVLTITGAMTVAKMGLVVCDMIDNNMVNCVISTGALMAHGLVEATGLTHFKYDPRMNDEKLYEYGYDRVYDTLELENNLNDVEVYIRNVLKNWNSKELLCSYKLLSNIGKMLKEDFPEKRAIVKSAYEKNVRIYVPAFTDSELGLDVGIHNRMRVANKEERITYDPFLDLDHYTDQVISAKRIGIITIGGGVPRNWAQQVGPYLDIMDHRSKGLLKFPMKRFHYGIRICPEPVHWGGLSGCTYSEGISWGKFVPPAEGGQFAEVLVDATVAWPLLVRAGMERVKRTKTTLTRATCFG